MHLNVGYNNIFLCHGGKECAGKQPSYMSSPSYIAPAFKLCIFIIYSKVHVVGFLQHFELERPSNCKLCGRVFKCRSSIRGSQRSSPWNGLFVWVMTGVKFLWRHLVRDTITLQVIFEISFKITQAFLSKLKQFKRIFKYYKEGDMHMEGSQHHNTTKKK